MRGILLVDKPKQWTSHDVCQYVKRKFGLKKVGHTGTLDPNATGVLVLLLESATTLAETFINDQKGYAGTFTLGIRTSSGDSDGTVIAEKDVSQITPDVIRTIAREYSGDILQRPPMVSAVKKNGVRLYTLARKGQDIPREPRKVTVFDFSITAITVPLVTFSLLVSKGFYVRALVDEIGERLGCGATLTELRRTQSGIFSISDCISLEQIKSLQGIEELSRFCRR